MNQQPRAPRRQRVLVSFASALLAGAAAFGSANASTPINPGVATVSVASAAHLGAKDVILGTLSATQQLHIVVSLKLRNQVQLDNFIATATNLNKAVAKRHMSRAQFAAEHSPTVAQADSVKQFLLNNGFSKVTIAPNRLLVSAYASAAVVESAFKTPLVQVHTAHGENAYANTASVQVPMALQDTVQTVLGLQNVRHPRTFLRHAKTHGNASTYAVTGHNPTEFPHIYGADGLPTASTVTVGIITAGDMTQTLTDLATFASQNSLDPVNTQVVTVGNGSSDTSGTGEWNMDSQAIIGMSGGVQKLVIYAADSMSFADLTSAMNTAVNDSANNPVAINMSFGACESNSSAAAAEGQVFQAGIALGMTFAASSGDDGADCDSNSNFGVADPASSPFVVAVGGTRVNTSNGDYSSESAWSSGGGGFSTFQPKPAWQTMVSGNFRSVPDVAFDGDPSSGAEVIINGSTQIIGGTSLSAPIFVGAWARLRAANPALTFAAPYLYSTLTAGDYNDITTGSNATTQSGGQYASGPGFDQTSGFGSFKMAQVAADIGAPGAPSVSLSFSPSSIGINDTSTLTISLSNVSQPSTAAVLNADFTDTLPTGLSVAATPNISTTCSGSVTAAANSITLPNGSSIAAQTACTINVDVTAVGNGTYANTVATGALQTTLGNNAYAASATLTVGNGLSTPIASVAPGTLNFSGSGSQTLTVANTGGGSLTYSLDEAAYNAVQAPTTHEAHSFSVDDGTMEKTDALADDTKEYASIWLNRFPVSGSLSINSVSIFWPSVADAGGDLTSKQATLLVYFDADSDGNPGNAVVLDNEQVSISSQGAYQAYPVSVAVPAAGDVYIGFSDSWANGGTTPNLTPVAEDTDTPKHQSLIIYNGTGDAPDLANLSNNSDIGVFSNSNLMVRASGTSTYNSTNCASPSAIAWLSATPVSGTIIGGHSDDITVTADAGTLANGLYSALLCATTNDTLHSLIAVPVTLNVGGVGPVNQLPVANFSITSNALTANFTDTSSDSDGTVTAWTWDFGDGSPVATVQNPSHTYAAAGTYTVSLTVTDDDSASSSPATQPVTVSQPTSTTPSLATSFTPSTVAVGAPSTVTITFTNPNATVAKLTSTFRNNLPSGLATVANTVAMTCGGSNNPTQTAYRFTLPKHSTIPANASCTMTGDVTAANVGSYTNTLAINALKTDAGNNATAASATLTVTSSSGTPVATVSSTALTDSLQVGASDSQTLTIGNTGTADLTFNIAEAAPQQIVLGLHSKNAQLAAKQLHAADAKLSMMPIAVGTTQVLPANVAQPLGSLSFAHDDGSAETSIVWSDQAQTIEYAAIYLNRFTPPAGTGAFTINTVSVEWPNQGTASSNTLVGQQARIVAYYDADGDGDPSNATYLGQSSVTIASEDAFETYNVSFDVAGAGDIYVGFEDAWAEAGYTPLLAPGGLDTTSSAGDSFLYGMNDNNAPDLQNLANNTFGKTIDTAGFAGNWLIRATGTTLGGPSATCANPTSVPWLSVSPVSGSVTAAGSIAVTVGFDATGMVVGNYTALLCIATNDPNQASIEVPVSMDVTACAAAPADRLFADGFELASSGCDGGNANLVTGTINQAVTNTINGSAFNFVTGTYVADNGGTTDDDINLWSSGGTLEIFWPDTNHTSIGCQADANGHCKVLQSGATVGTPGQTFAGVTDELTLWLAGVDGYLGVAFWNESTSELDYGYIHMTTTASSGFPAQWLEYGYDASGAPVTIP